MHISPSASRRFRVNKATVSPTGVTPVSQRVSARTQFSSRKGLSFSPVPTEGSGSSAGGSAGRTVDAHRDKGAARVSLISQGSEQELVTTNNYVSYAISAA